MAVGLLACAHATAGPAGTAAPAAPPNDAPAAAGEAIPWRYEVHVQGPELSIEARFAPGVAGTPQVDDDARAFVRDVATSEDRGWRIVRYRFALGEAARTLMDVDSAIASGEVFAAPPSTWLMRPDATTPGDFRLHVVADPPSHFIAGTHPSPDGAPDTYQASTADLDAASFAVFGPFHLQTVTSGAARVLVSIAPHDLALGDGDVAAWAKTAIDAIAGYLHRDFPVPRTLVVVMRGKGDATRGETLGDGGPAVLIRAGDGVTPATTRDDWVMTHELIHVIMPSLPHHAVWLSEGVPSYVEPLARVRLGTLPPDKMWRDLVEGLPQGLPEPGDEGLERTHTWGRTYWGGSLFCFMADVRIREQTRNQHSFGDVIRAVVATGADVESRWDVDRFLDVGDAATGTRALHDLYRDLALSPGSVDLTALWRRLGIVLAGEHVTFDDTAPLAAVRRGIEGG